MSPTSTPGRRSSLVLAPYFYLLCYFLLRIVLSLDLRRFFIIIIIFIFFVFPSCWFYFSLSFFRFFFFSFFFRNRKGMFSVMSTRSRLYYSIRYWLNNGTSPVSQKYHPRVERCTRLCYYRIKPKTLYDVGKILGQGNDDHHENLASSRKAG